MYNISRFSGTTVNTADTFAEGFQADKTTIFCSKLYKRFSLNGSEITKMINICNKYIF